MAAQAGTQGKRRAVTLDPRFRGGDERLGIICFVLATRSRSDSSPYGVNASGAEPQQPRRYLRRRAASWFKVSTATENPIAA
jgi:hypothetical protein